jgi:hypothetical protein
MHTVEIAKRRPQRVITTTHMQAKDDLVKNVVRLILTLQTIEGRRRKK